LIYFHKPRRLFRTATPLRACALACIALFACGCQGNATRPVSRSAVAISAPSYERIGLTGPIPVMSVRALCDPPIGWLPDPLKQDERHTHQVWVSPTRKTAYGVIHFGIPLPVGLSFVYWNFLAEMKRKQGYANLIEKHYDAQLPGMRFVVDDPIYRVRFNLIVNGFEGWAVYAGTLRAEAIDAAELQLAEKAREHTVLGLPDQTAAR
jgi:hypothetical protein